MYIVPDIQHKMHCVAHHFKGHWKGFNISLTTFNSNALCSHTIALKTKNIQKRTCPRSRSTQNPIYKSSWYMGYIYSSTKCCIPNWWKSLGHSGIELTSMQIISMWLIDVKYHFCFVLTMCVRSVMCNVNLSIKMFQVRPSIHVCNQTFLCAMHMWWR